MFEISIFLFVKTGEEKRKKKLNKKPAFGR
jgi:hypothetical protein